MSQQHTSQHDTSQDHTGPDHFPDAATLVTREFWEARYGSTDKVWSGNPNLRLVEQVADLLPGSALDVGCGEGADAIWLASRGWQVTAVDISSVALDRAAGWAADAGEEVAARITWRQADILSWAPPPRQFDLVSAQFVHLPSELREGFHRRLAAAVRPGGTLLVVVHHPSDLETTVGRWNVPDYFFTADEIAAVLDPDDWRIVVVGDPERQATDPDGRPITIRDAVLRAERRR